MGILEVSYPIRHTKMAEVDYGHDLQFAQARKRGVAKVPVIVVGTEKRAIKRRPVSQELDAQFLYQCEIGFPVLVMTAFFKLIYSHPTTIDCRDAVFYPSGKEKS